MLPEARSKAEAGAGHAPYIDLLEEQPDASGTVQRLMITSAVPRIYERYWRPALGKVAKGMTGPSMKNEIRIARLLLGLRPGDGVLDIGCGPGNFSRPFAQTVGGSGLVVGLDASPTMLTRGAQELADTELENLVLIRGNATELPFVDQSFDAICCFAALHLFDDPFAALDEMARVVTPGGRIALLTSVQRQLVPRGAFKPLAEKLSGMRVFRREEIPEALEARGFTEVRQIVMGLVQMTGARMRSNKGQADA